VKDWVRVKRDTLVLGVRKSLQCRLNGRSADYIAPSAANGCAMACAYCYVPRRKGFANPITTFVNNDEILAYLARHARRLGPKREPNQVDPAAWVYDVGENSDVSVDALVSDNVRDTVALFRGLPDAKASFATKYVNPDLLGYDPRGRTRVRFSLMPRRPARVLDVRTSPDRPAHPRGERLRRRGLRGAPQLLARGRLRRLARRLPRAAARGRRRARRRRPRRSSRAR
jgi:DNA repair photolyase